MFRILFFYRDEKALENYLDKFYLTHDPTIIKRVASNWREYLCDGVLIKCIRGISNHSRGHKADLLIVQNALNLLSNWKMMKDTVLEPMRMSPIPIQVFPDYDNIGEPVVTCGKLIDGNELKIDTT